MVTQLNIMSSQLKGAPLVDNVEQEEDHVLLYIREVRGIHSGQYYMMLFRFITIYVSVFLLTVTKDRGHQPQLRAHTGDPCAEPKASRDQDL